MGAVLALAINLVAIDCGECGGSYAINERYRQQKIDKGGYWNCPYCKCSWGFGESALQKKQKELDAKSKELEAERTRKQAALERANLAEEAKAKLERAAKRAKTRTAAGVCPCCPRTFVNLSRHIATKHPDYKDKS